MKAWTLVVAMLVCVPAFAESKKQRPAAKPPATEAKPPATEAKQAEAQAPEPGEPGEPAPEDPLAGLAHTKGPKLVSLHGEIEIDLPAGAVLLDQSVAADWVRKDGGDPEGVLGALIDPAKNWLVMIHFAPVGYVTDSDAHELDKDALLADYQRGTLEQNKKRVQLGVPELFIDRWSEVPRYEPIKHHLVWGLAGHSTEGPIVNFFTRILGRGGYISVNLIDAPDTLEASKAETAALRSAIRFKEGYRYEDFREGDKSSGMGLKTLIVGGGVVAAKKAGVLAGLLVAFKKVFVFIALGIAGAFRWLFGRKKQPPAEAPPPDPTPTT